MIIVTRTPKRKKLGAVLGIVLLLTMRGIPAHAQGGTTVGTTTPDFTNAGSSGSVFSKIWVGARASALAGAYSALADDISALYWNPAGIARLPGVNVGASYTRWFADVTHNFIGATMPI